MKKGTVHIIGFGSQASAWAQCLKMSGWQVQIYLNQGSKSFQRAKDLGFSPFLISQLPDFISSPTQTYWVAMLCPDSLIAPLYREFIASSEAEVRLILAHGYAVYSGDLKLKGPLHKATLLAPKAIGPKLLQNFKSNFPDAHSLKAAVHADSADETGLTDISIGLGFRRESLIRATFDQETIGDLISEQGLLCGGVFNLLDLTATAMKEAGVPDSLIREECLTELELIVGMIREKGPAVTFQSISHAAQAGTVAFSEQVLKDPFKERFKELAKNVQNGSFIEYASSGQWKSKAAELRDRLTQWENAFKL